VPAWVENRDALLAYVDIVRVVGIADAVRVRAGEHRVDVHLPGWNPMQGDADQLGVPGHRFVGQLLRVDLLRGRRPVFLRRIGGLKRHRGERGAGQNADGDESGKSVHGRLVEVSGWQAQGGHRRFFS